MTQTARDIADGLMEAHTHAPPELRVVSKSWHRYPEHIKHRDAIESALIAYGNARIEEAAKVADNYRLKQGDDAACIASAIRSLKEAP